MFATATRPSGLASHENCWTCGDAIGVITVLSIAIIRIFCCVWRSYERWTASVSFKQKQRNTRLCEIRQLVLRASAAVTNSRSGHVSCFSGGSKVRCDCNEYKSSFDAFRSDLNLWNRHRWPRCFGKASPLSQIVICSSQTQSVHFSLFLQRLPIGTDFYER